MIETFVESSATANGAKNLIHRSQIISKLLLNDKNWKIFQREWKNGNLGSFNIFFPVKFNTFLTSSRVGKRKEKKKKILSIPIFRLLKQNTFWNNLFWFDAKRKNCGVVSSKKKKCSSLIFIPFSIFHDIQANWHLFKWNWYFFPRSIRKSNDLGLSMNDVRFFYDLISR